MFEKVIKTLSKNYISLHKKVWLKNKYSKKKQIGFVLLLGKFKNFHWKDAQMDSIHTPKCLKNTTVPSVHRNSWGWKFYEHRMKCRAEFKDEQNRTSRSRDMVIWVRQSRNNKKRNSHFLNFNFFQKLYFSMNFYYSPKCSIFLKFIFLFMKFHFLTKFLFAFLIILITNNGNGSETTELLM